MLRVDHPLTCWIGKPFHFGMSLASLWLHASQSVCDRSNKETQRMFVGWSVCLLLVCWGYVNCKTWCFRTVMYYISWRCAYVVFGNATNSSQELKACWILWAANRPRHWKNVIIRKEMLFSPLKLGSKFYQILFDSINYHPDPIEMP